MKKRISKIASLILTTLLFTSASFADWEIKNHKIFKTFSRSLNKEQLSPSIISDNWLSGFKSKNNTTLVMTSFTDQNQNTWNIAIDPVDLNSIKRDASFGKPSYEHKAWVKMDINGNILEMGASFLSPSSEWLKHLPKAYRDSNIEQIKVIFKTDSLSSKEDESETIFLANW